MKFFKWPYILNERISHVVLKHLLEHMYVRICIKPINF